MSRALGAAVWVEARKAAASRVLLGVTVLLVAGVAAITAGMTAAVDGGNEQLQAKLGPAAEGGWSGMLSSAYQVTGAAGLLAFGVGLSWTYGREFADGTVAGLFGLPVRRATVALAKLVVYLLWTVATAVALTVVVGLAGTLTTGSMPDASAWAGLGRLLALAAMTALLPVPAAWAATLGRGLLPGIATTVALLATAQVIVVAGAGAGWFPFAAPALWAVLPGTVGTGQLALVAGIPVTFGLATLLTWDRLQLD